METNTIISLSSIIGGLALILVLGFFYTIISSFIVNRHLKKAKIKTTSRIRTRKTTKSKTLAKTKK